MKDRNFYNMKALLVREGYVNVPDSYIDAALEYLDTMMAEQPEYTIFQWLADTKTNYPEDLEPFIEKEDE